MPRATHPSDVLHGMRMRFVPLFELAHVCVFVDEAGCELETEAPMRTDVARAICELAHDFSRAEETTRAWFSRHDPARGER